MAAQDVLESVKKNKLEIGDFKFVDPPGLWHHFPIPGANLTPDVFEDSIGFDGSSIRGFQSSLPGLDEAMRWRRIMTLCSEAMAMCLPKA
jgi:glutamine synthetase